MKMCIRDRDNVVLPEGAVGDTITSANAADGSVSFGNIQFKAAGNYHVEITDCLLYTSWNQVVKDSTENIGRIWTDKTVLTEDIQLEGGSRPSCLLYTSIRGSWKVIE